WLCGELGLVKPALVGHSMGGAIVLATAARHPKLPRAIALCDPAVIPPPFIKAAVDPFIAALRTPGWRDVARGFIGERLFGPNDDKARAAQITEGMLATPQHVMVSAFESLFQTFDSEAAARACKVPALLIDAEAPIPDRARFRELCPQIAFAQT